MSRKRPGLVRPRRARRALNVAAATLGVWWLGADHPVPADWPVAHATTVEWTERGSIPSVLRKALLWGGLDDGADWREVGHVADSGQRVVWPEDWCDPALRIIEPKPTKGVVAAAEPGERPSAVRSSERARDQAEQTEAGSRRAWFTVTAYCPCETCCGRWARYHATASGLPLSYNGGHLVAADTQVLAFHTRVRIPGYADEQPVPVVDRGALVQGQMLDVFFPSHERATQWGRKRLLVEIVP